jgi:mRNA interferase HigB
VRLFDKRTLVQFGRLHPPARGPLLVWAKAIGLARYATPAQIRQQHATADFFADNKVCFNICGNNYRLIVKFIYAKPTATPPLHGMVLVIFIGTHADYSKLTKRDIAKL